jgi:hypothetical protein
VELSISSVEAQLVKYRQLLKENGDSELAVLNHMLMYVNTTISNFTLKREYPEKPEDFPEKSMVRQNAKLWYKVAQLHLRDLEDMEDSVATLRKSLPVVPNRNTGKIPVRAQFDPPNGAHVVNMQAYREMHDHLLNLRPEKSPINLRTSSQGSFGEAKADIPQTLKTVKSFRPTITEAGGTQTPVRTERSNKSSDFIWGWKWNFPGTSSQPLTAEKMDHMMLVCPRQKS